MDRHVGERFSRNPSPVFPFLESLLLLPSLLSKLKGNHLQYIYNSIGFSKGNVPHNMMFIL